MGESGRVGARPWIVPGAGSQFAEAHGLIDLFSRHNGFYWLVVSLTFAANQRLFGLEPFGYGYPWTAPSYYTFTFAPGLVLGNLADDMDRTSTLALLHAIGREMRPTRRRALLFAAPLVAIALLPVYWSRNVRLMRQAQLSRLVLAE